MEPNNPHNEQSAGGVATAEPPAPPTQSQSAPVPTTDNITQPPELPTPLAPQPTEPAKPKKNNMWLWVALAVVIIIAVGIVFLTRSSS
jgi:uncharacterized membrane protein